MKKQTMLVLALLVSFAFCGSAYGLTFLGNYDNHDYWLEEANRINWTDAKAGAESAVSGESYLAVITSEDEQSMLDSWLSDYNGQYWLGGYQEPETQDPAENWQWVNGEDWSYTRPSKFTINRCPVFGFGLSIPAYACSAKQAFDGQHASLFTSAAGPALSS